MFTDDQRNKTAVSRDLLPFDEFSIDDCIEKTWSGDDDNDKLYLSAVSEDFSEPWSFLDVDGMFEDMRFGGNFNENSMAVGPERDRLGFVDDCTESGLLRKYVYQPTPSPSNVDDDSRSATSLFFTRHTETLTNYVDGNRGKQSDELTTAKTARLPTSSIKRKGNWHCAETDRFDETSQIWTEADCRSAAKKRRCYSGVSLQTNNNDDDDVDGHLLSVDLGSTCASSATMKTDDEIHELSNDKKMTTEVRQDPSHCRTLDRENSLRWSNPSDEFVSLSAATDCWSEPAADLPADLPFALPALPTGCTVVVKHHCQPVIDVESDHVSDETCHMTQIIINYPTVTSTGVSLTTSKQPKNRAPTSFPFADSGWLAKNSNELPNSKIMPDSIVDFSNLSNDNHHEDSITTIGSVTGDRSSFNSTVHNRQTVDLDLERIDQSTLILHKTVDRSQPALNYESIFPALESSLHPDEKHFICTSSSTSAPRTGVATVLTAHERRQPATVTTTAAVHATSPVSCADFHPCDPKYRIPLNPEHQHRTDVSSGLLSLSESYRSSLGILTTATPSFVPSAVSSAGTISPECSTSCAGNQLSQHFTDVKRRVSNSTIFPLDRISPTNFNVQFSSTQRGIASGLSPIAECSTPSAEHEPKKITPSPSSVRSSSLTSTSTVDYSSFITSPKGKQSNCDGTSSPSTEDVEFKPILQSQNIDHSDQPTYHLPAQEVPPPPFSSTDRSTKFKREQNTADSMTSTSATQSTSKSGIVGSSRRTIEALSVKIRKNLEQKHIKLSTTTSSMITSTTSPGACLPSPQSSSPTADTSPQLPTDCNTGRRDRRSWSDTSELTSPAFFCSSPPSLLLRPASADGQLSQPANNDDYQKSRDLGAYRNENICDQSSTIDTDDGGGSISTMSNNIIHLSTAINTYANGSDEFRLSLDAPVSTLSQTDTERITYLNKGQYYRLSIEYFNDEVTHPSSTEVRMTSLGDDSMLHHSTAHVDLFKSVVMVQFRDPAAIGDEMEAWRLWHSRQPSFKQRILDIDYKNSCGVGPNSMQELAYNATSVVWSPSNQPVKVNIAVNCLSTDFSTQKGVKGIPLNIQVDTYNGDGPDAMLVHSAVCRIKVFCEKGAERKIRDEERKKGSQPKSGAASSNSSDTTINSNFQAVKDSSRVPVLFLPSNNMISAITTTATAKPLEKTLITPTRSSSGLSDTRNVKVEDRCPSFQTCACRDTSDRHSEADGIKPALLLYVRKPRDREFTPLHLRSPTVTSLILAIEEFCGIQADWIKNVYRRSKRGITIKMDDQILRHYSNESAFVVSTSPSSVCMQHVASINNHRHKCDVVYDVILTDTDGNDSWPMV